MNIITPLKLTGLSLLLLLLASTAQANETDPLSQTELAKALAISSANPNLSQGAAQRNRRINDNAQPLAIPPELLLIERRIMDKEQAAQRLADVYHYDYSRNETIHTVVDLDTQQVISTQHQQRMQLPLTENELQRSSDIIFSDPEQAALIRNEYQRITHRYLSSPKQLNIKAFAFSADALSEQLNPASQQCGLHRCAQVLLYTHDSIVFEISPIVNLSAGIVTQNIGY